MSFLSKGDLCAERKAQILATPGEASRASAIPDYLKRTYAWAYLWPRSIRLLDRGPVVSAILWGNYRRLVDLTLAEFRPGQRVLQPACVYGDLSPRLAGHLGQDGRLNVADIAPQQVANCRGKMAGFANASVTCRDAGAHAGDGYDAVCCFFLLHELPDDHKRRVAAALLDAVRPGGHVVFVDYHRPHAVHPLRPVMGLVFDLLEPYARALWSNPIRAYAPDDARFAWSTETYFGGLYQKTVARRSA